MRGPSCVVLTLLLACLAPAQDKPVPRSRERVKYVIFMIADGMGFSDITATRIRKNGISGPPLWLETLEHIGYQRTYSEKNTVTDSAAAASAFACGEKFVNEEICFHADGRPYQASLLELAKRRDMATGLVATKNITDATPAAFAAHVRSRDCEQEIARQYIQQTRPDILLGGGRSKFASTAPDRCGAAGDFLAQATALGYRGVTTAAELQSAVRQSAPKLLGLFARSKLTPEYLRASTPAAAEQPRLPDMASAALSVLQKNRNGFFLMIEGSQVDLGNHDENYEYQYGELAAFDDTVKRVLDWINADSDRRRHTLLVITSDHDTAGFAVAGPEKPGAESLGQFSPGWVFPLRPGEQAHHTGGDVLVWSRGPGSEALNRSMENTWIYRVLAAALK